MNRSELVTWMNNMQMRLGDILVGEDISSTVLAVVQSPSVITYKVQIEPDKAKVEKMRNLGTTFEQGLGVAPIRVYPATGYFVVELPSPNPVSPHAEMLVDHINYPTICIGYDTDVQPVTFDLSRYPSMLFVAPPRSGKTSAMRSLIYALLKKMNSKEEKISVIICAEKLQYWRAFIGKRGIVGVYSDFQEMTDILNIVSLSLSKKAKVGDVFDPPLFIVVDDLLRVLAQAPKLGTVIGEIASTGGSANVVIGLITQSSGSNLGTGGIKVEDNIATRIVYRTTSAASAARSTGSDSSGVEELSGKQGDAMLIQSATKARITTAHVEDLDISKLANVAPNEHPAFLQSIASIMNKVTVEGTPTAIVQPIMVQPEAEDLNLRISPPRELTDDEVRKLSRIITHYANIGTPLSNNKLLDMLYGNKNGKYSEWLRDAKERMNKV